MARSGRRVRGDGMTTLPAWLPPLLLAPFVGSFLGVVIRRLPRGEPVAWSRSRCEACKRPLSAAELVPVMSYVLQGGRCRGCGAAIDPFHWRVEVAALVVALSAVLAAEQPLSNGLLWTNCALGWTLLTLAWIDLDHERLPDALTLPLIVGGLAATAAMEPWAILDHALGAVLGYAILRLLAYAYRALRGREGIGGGDAKLLAAAGAWVGWQELNSILVLGALAGLTTALLQRRVGEGLGGGTVVPFGPGLALGLWLVRLQGGAFPGWG